MTQLPRIFLLLVAVLTLSACVADRADRRSQLNEKMAVPYDSGAIFKTGINERPLYEERRARNIGDGLIVNVVDAMAATKKTASKDKSADKSSGDSADSGSDSQRRRSSDEEDGGDLTNIASDALLGPVQMTVIDILDNGNLLVSGGRQVKVNEEDKYLRITGVVDPANLVGGNTLQSTQLSAAHIQIDNVRVRADGTTSSVNEGNSVFGNFFQSASPR